MNKQWYISNINSPHDPSWFITLSHNVNHYLNGYVYCYNCGYQ